MLIIPDPTGPITQVIEETGRSGGWAAVLLGVGLVVMGYFGYLLVKHVIDDSAAQNRKNLEQLRADHAAQMERERMLTDRYDETLQKVNSTFGEVGEVMRQSNSVLERTTVALDRNSDLLERLAPQRRNTWGESEGHW